MFDSKTVNLRAVPCNKEHSVNCMHFLLRRCKRELWHTFTVSVIHNLDLSQVCCLSLERSCAIANGGANRCTQNILIRSHGRRQETAGTSEALVELAVGTNKAFAFLGGGMFAGATF